MVNCPKCDVTMAVIKVGHVRVDRCEACGGMWFDGREHEVISESKAKVAKLDFMDPAVGAKMNERHDIKCPICHVEMIRMSVPSQLHIKYESCPVCHGSFFDAGELKDYATFSITEQIKAIFAGFRR